MEKLLCKLDLPYQEEALHIALNITDQLALQTGLRTTEITQLKVALDEALTNTLQYNLQTVNKENIGISYYQVDEGLQVRIHEYGIPFDPESFPEYRADAIERGEETKGLGVFLIRNMVTSAEFKALGKNGKETILTQLRKDAHASGNDEITEKEAVQAQPQAVEDVTIREIQPEEAVEVAKEAYLAYGYSYLFEEIYNPAVLRELNRSRDFVSIIAINPEGTILGHLAVIKNKRFPKTAEFGAAFVNPRFRGGGILKKMNYTALETAQKESIDFIFVDCVTSHTYSQKAAANFGLKDTCLLLGRLSDVAFNEITNIGYRESLMMAFYPLVPTGGISLYVPGHHKEMMEQLMGNAGFACNHAVGTGSLSGRMDTTEIEISSDRSGATFLHTQHVGSDFPAVLQQLLKRVCFGGSKVVYLLLSLNEDCITELTVAAESSGFFFAGMMPADAGSYYLVLQYMNNCSVNYDLIQIASETGKKLKEYIMELDPNKEYYQHS